MKRSAVRISIIVGVLSLFATLTVLAIGTLRSEEVYAHSECTLTTLNGTYLFHAQGDIVDGEAALPYVEAGSWTLDGQGNAEGVFSASIGGVTIADREAFSATYELASGCAFTALAPVGDEFLEFHLYTTPAGSTMTYYSAGFSGVQLKQ